VGAAALPKLCGLWLNLAFPAFHDVKGFCKVAHHACATHPAHTLEAALRWVNTSNKMRSYRRKCGYPVGLPPVGEEIVADEELLGLAIAAVGVSLLGVALAGRD
jgi:hypothetical protein